MSLQIVLSQGTIIGGHYVISSLLNSGGFGAVYRGMDTSGGNRPCAIKETYDVTPAARRQALMEAGVLLTVRNPHLPEVYDAFEFNGRFYLIMQLIEGQNLLQLLKSRIPGGLVGEAEPHQQLSGPCSEQEVLEWLLPIMDVLQELHSRHPPILHRDIKPGNLILTPQQKVVLVDFGLTKLYDPTRTTQSMVRAVSAGFSPLEQYMGKTSPQSDIYSMSVTMYLLLTNRLPSPAVTRSMSDDLIEPRLLNPLISPNVERILLKALALHADQRYQSMGEFAQALRAPAFTAFGDPTAVLTPSAVEDEQAQVVPTIAANPPASPSPTAYAPTVPVPPISPAHANAGGQPVPAPSYGKPKPSKTKGPRPALQKNQPPQTYPVLPPSGSISGYGGPARANRQAQRLPNPSTQGCLWGALLGIGAGLIICCLKQEADFYLAWFLGFIGYLAVGFFTTRRGGHFVRGGRAGYSAGVTSLLLFGITAGICLMIAFSQHLQSLTSSSDGQTMDITILQTAWNAAQPAWPSLVILPDQSPFINVLAVLGVTVFMAWFLGLVGGVMGTIQNLTDAVNRQRQIPHP